jgi:hypothetical protein
MHLTTQHAFIRCRPSLMATLLKKKSNLNFYNYVLIAKIQQFIYLFYIQISVLYYISSTVIICLFPSVLTSPVHIPYTH